MKYCYCIEVFDTRILYVSESGSQKNKIKRLAIMDQDGGNHKYLTDGKSLVLTPRFSPNQQLITFFSYSGINAGLKPSVYLYNLSTGKIEILGHHWYICPRGSTLPHLIKFSI